MVQHILTAVKLDMPKDRQTFERIKSTLHDFELSHVSPSATHFDLSGQTMHYNFTNAGDAIYFGKRLQGITSVSYASEYDFKRLTRA